MVLVWKALRTYEGRGVVPISHSLQISLYGGRLADAGGVEGVHWES